TLNVWTAAAPDFLPVNLTGFVRNEVFEIPSVRITDDGSIVVYVRDGNPNRQGWVINPTSNPDGVEQAIWAIDVRSKKSWKVTSGNDPVLSPDGKWILITKGGAIFRASLEQPASSGQTSPPKQLFKAQGQNGDPKWSPDGQKIAFVSRREDHNFIGVYDSAKHKITWMAPGVDRDSNPCWTADGRQIVFFRRPGAQFNEIPTFREMPETAIWIADAETGKGRELWKQAPDEKPRYHTIRELYVTANDRVLFTAEHDNWYHVFSLPFSGGEPVDLTPGEGFVEHTDISGDGKTLYFSSNLADIHGRHIWKVPTAGGKAAQLSQGATIGTYPVALSTGTKIAFLYATATYPTSVAAISVDGGKPELIASKTPPEGFPIDALVIPELVIVKAEDGLEIPCQLFLPKDIKAGEKRPAVIYTHGGPIRQMLLGWHYMHFYSEAYGINQYFANKGYVVLSINYRSGIGYGRSFRNAENCGWQGAAEHQDLVAGAKYLQSRPDVDPGRIGLWGLSYGGVMTAMGLARNSDIFKVGVDMAGVHDWSQFSRRMGRAPEEMIKTAYESSAVASVDTWTSPVLFIHGDDDRNVPFSQTTDLVQKLRTKGDVHIELLIYPDEPHEILEYGSRMEAYNATFDFINKFLKKE
ncbi:MAG: S9 family peptidase, partial [Candidatus Aminicenantes bacterium]|nr:S9 family peptidase [Candidatus Aminicenantes bacterium]